MCIGIAARTKINANIGNSAVTSDIDGELEKLHTAVHFGADTVMDLSTGRNIDAIRQAIIDASPVPIGTVPLYQMVQQLDDICDMTPQHFLDMVEHQAKQGVDYMTVHAGILLEHLHLTTQPGHGHRQPRRLADRQVDDAPSPAESALHALRRPVRHHARVRRHLEPGRQPAAGLDRRRQRRRPVRRAGRAGRADQAGLGQEHAGDGRRPRPHAHGPDRHEHQAADASLPRGAVLRAGAARDRHRARLRPHHQRHRRAPWPAGAARPCSATSRPRSTWACRRTKT